MVETRMPVRDAMTRGVVTANIDMSAAEVSQRMQKFKVGGVIITQGGEPVGIVTERDLVGKVLARDEKPSSISVGEIMSSPLTTISPETDVMKAAQLMMRLGVRRLPVVKDGELVGIITDTDLIAISTELGDIIEDLIGISRETEYAQGEEAPRQGVCERCMSFGLLENVQGQFLCQECKEEELGG